MPKKLTITLHDAQEEMPDRSTKVVVFELFKNNLYAITDVRFSSVHQQFNCGDDTDLKLVEERRHTFDNVRYWAYMEDVNAAIKKVSK